MNTFLSALETAIEAAVPTTSVQLRRLIDTGDKVRSSYREWITIVPGRDIPVKAENAVSYLVQCSARVRASVVYPTDAEAISKLALLWQNVRQAIYGQAWGGRRYVEPEFADEYTADPETSNLYYYDVEVFAEFQESTSD
jgi:hypothetical protein